MAKPQGLLSPVERQTYEAFGMLPDSERLSILPRYSKTKGLLAPQFLYDAAQAISSPATAAQGYELGPQEALNVAMTATGGSSVGTAPRGALNMGMAYHGSPHIFNKFDLSKIGTGEGQQMIATGVYLSESKDFAGKFMQDQRGQAAPTIASKYLKNWGDNNLAIQKLDERYKTLLGESSPSFAQPYKDAADMLRRGETDFSGSLYKVDLPDSKARRMLDYDKELKRQPKNIRNIAIQNGVDLNDTGFDLLQKVGRDQAGAEKLKNAGITGVKYSNEMTPGTTNYVVFDPNYLKILERNKKPVK